MISAADVPLLYAKPGAASITFRVAAVGWAVFETVMRLVQRARRTGGRRACRVRQGAVLRDGDQHGAVALGAERP